MPSFQGKKNIYLQPQDDDVAYSFEFTVCTGAATNDGALPYGTTISSVEVKAYSSAGTDVTTQIVGTPTLASNVVTVPLTYPATAGAGRYKLRFVATLSTGAKMEFDFDRVNAKDL